MNGVRILICDSDKSYVDALVRYLLGSGQRFYVSYLTEQAAYEKEEGAFDIGLMTEEYIRLYENDREKKLHIRHVIQLCSTMEIGYRTYDSLYKFQSMNTFLDKLSSMEWKNLPPQSRYAGKTRIMGVYSPMRHELELPFALTYARFLAEKGKTIFLDIEENSILNQLVGREPECNLVDAIYEIEQQKDNFRIEVCLETYHGFSYLAPVSNPSELAHIREKQWLELIHQIQKSSFTNVVMLFGTLPQGFLSMLKEMNAIYLLGKAGSYYQTGTLQFAASVKKMNPEISIQEVLLPLNAGNMSKGYCMEELMDGNLGVFVRNHFGGLQYARA
ncbi:MAG: hypothetical protein PUE58_04765 [Lachnospiraceae bacterium]|nr:hypothetical protein [Lachnospiraceae bacterium]